jgi:hypothetical protein
MGATTAPAVVNAMMMQLLLERPGRPLAILDSLIEFLQDLTTRPANEQRRLLLNAWATQPEQFAKRRRRRIPAGSGATLSAVATGGTQAHSGSPNSTVAAGSPTAAGPSRR